MKKYRFTVYTLKICCFVGECYKDSSNILIYILYNIAEHMR